MALLDQQSLAHRCPTRLHGRLFVRGLRSDLDCGYHHQRVDDPFGELTNATQQWDLF